ncbi:MAG TPA: bifunctional UDP-N-acetylglucosamine diphosphorylase/glucosamine-1-phosphate N-acetyltransferase GlmU [Acidobacteriaceae bacterium]
MSFAIAIMAAGKGTRLKSKRPKVLHEIGGKPLLLHVVSAALKVVPASDIYVIIGHQAEQVRAVVAPTGVRLVEQVEQRGTGHAIQAAAAAVAAYDNLLVLSGDVPLLRTETILRVRDFHLAEQAAMTVLTATPADPTGYGRVARVIAGGDVPAQLETSAVARIIEQKALSGTEQQLREINTGIYAFRTAPLLAHLGELETNNAHGELYLTDMAALLVKAKERVVALRAEDTAELSGATEVLGANTIAEMMLLDRALRHAMCARLMAQGVTIFQPETVVIDPGVRVGPDTVLEPFTQLLGSTVMGERCRVRSYSVLENTTVGDGVTVRQGCIVEDSEIGSDVILGPYAHLRPGSRIGQGAHIGNFVELKNVQFGVGSKAGHLAYLGDAVIGSGVNIGAGTILCNYDGVQKHQTTIGDEVFIGSDSVLVAPVSIGKGAYVAAASCVTQSVPEDALAVGRARQVNKEGWAAKRRAMSARKKN